MSNNRRLRYGRQVIILALIAVPCIVRAETSPTVIRASDPVLPNETVALIGGGDSPGVLAAILRRNVIQNNGTIYIQHMASDVLVEHCSVRDTDRAIMIDGEARHVLLRDNIQENVQKLLCGDGLKNAVVVPGR